MKKVEGIWWSKSAGYLFFRPDKGFVISAHLDDEGKYMAYGAWYKHMEDYTLKIKLHNYASSLPWKTIYYRFLGDYLQWNNEQKGFFLLEVTHDEISDKIVSLYGRVCERFEKSDR